MNADHIQFRGFDGFWYRCEVKTHAHWDEWGEQVTGYSQSVSFYKYAVVRETPKGVYLIPVGDRVTDPDVARSDNPLWTFNTKTGTFVLGKSMKQFACPTVELAWRDALRRKERHVRGCEARLARAMDERFALMIHKPDTQREPLK